MNFSEALHEIKNGRCLKRTGWNGKDMFIYLDLDPIINANCFPLQGKYAPGTHLVYQPRINIAYPCGSVFAWLASQGDLLAEDWELVD